MLFTGLDWCRRNGYNEAMALDYHETDGAFLVAELDRGRKERTLLHACYLLS